MQTLEFQATIDHDGAIRLPRAYRDAYGRQARFVMLLDEQSTADQSPVDEKPDATPTGSIRHNPAFGMWADTRGDSRTLLEGLRQKQWGRS